MSISPLARGLGKLISKGDWTFWWGDGTWYNLKAPLGNRPGWSAGEIIYFSYHDEEVRFFTTGDIWGSGDNNLLSKDDQAYLREIWTRLYYDPVTERQCEARRREIAQQEEQAKSRIAELERIGQES